MSGNKVILARPNLFIVKEMKRLILDCSFTPFAIEELEELETVQINEVSGVVISTGLSSSVNESYTDIIKKVRELLPNKPIILATMIDFKKAKKSLIVNLEKDKVLFNLLPIEEANGLLTVNKNEDLVVLQKTDITDDQYYPKTRDAIKKYFN